MFFIAYAFKGQVHVFAERVKIVSHSSCRTSAIFEYFCPLLRDVKQGAMYHIYITAHNTTNMDEKLKFTKSWSEKFKS